MRKVTSFEMTVGEHWALRPSKKDRLTHVLVVKLGNPTEAQLRVEDASEEDEGRQSWVPVTQLKCRWENVEEFRANEARWSALKNVRPAGDHTAAAFYVFDVLGAESVDVYYGMAHGIDEVNDADRLGRLLDWPPESFIQSRGAFMHEGSVLVHWDLTQEIAKQLVSGHPHEMATWVRNRIEKIERAFVEEAYDRRSENRWLKEEEVLEKIRYRDPDRPPVEQYILDWLWTREEEARHLCEREQRAYDELLIISFDVINELRTKRSKRANQLIHRIERFINLREADDPSA
jgi:hypothetical protein